MGETKSTTYFTKVISEFWYLRFSYIKQDRVEDRALEKRNHYTESYSVSKQLEQSIPYTNGQNNIDLLQIQRRKLLIYGIIFTLK